MMRSPLTSRTPSISRERPARSSFLYREDCMITNYRTDWLDAPVHIPENGGGKNRFHRRIEDKESGGGDMRRVALLMASCLLAATWAQESKPTAKPAEAGAKYWNTDQGKWSENPAVPGA